ncbi:MAG: glutamate ligase domain-containing protein [Hyphomicrobiales bacterium]
MNGRDPDRQPLLGRRYHFSGVGGSGMAPLAALAAALGATVTGSDRNLDRGVTLHVFESLRRAGVRLTPQDGSGVHEGLTALIHSTAVERTNPEFRRAEALEIPRIRRGSFLASLVSAKRAVAVAGTSGKSTVTAMIAHIFVAAGRDPWFLGGGAALGLPGATTPGGLRVGGSDWFVVETDESDGSVAECSAAVAVLTNLSRDHKEIEVTARHFEALLEKTRERVVVNVGDPVLERVTIPTGLPALRVAVEGVRTWAPPDLLAESIRLAPDGVSFRIGGAPARVPFPGRMTVENAAIAIAASVTADIAIVDAAMSLATFGGVRRRLERIGAAGGVDVFDDFAHNPVKISAALAALRPAGRFWVYYQPHGYGPTRFFADQLVDTFASGLGPEDRLLLAPIYDAGGTADRSIRSEDLAARLVARGLAVTVAPTREDALALVTEGARAGDRVVVMGARDDTLSVFARTLFAALVARADPAPARDKPR